jgi:small conductance mechanosensitive channel
MAEKTATLAGALRTSLDGEAVMLVKAGDLLGDLAVNLIIALIILAVTMWLSGWASRGAKAAIRTLPRTHADLTLQTFAGSVARSAVIIFGMIAVLRRLGVETTSIIAVLGAASLAIGLALQGALSNVAAGVLTLVFRPYQVGDAVTIAGRTGTVVRLDLFSTTLIDGEGLRIVVPNGKAFGDVIVNLTEIPNRRIEFGFPLEPGEDISLASRIALSVLKMDKRVLKTPPPWAKATAINHASLTLTVRAWVKPADYGEALSDLLQNLKAAFDAEPIRLSQPLPPVVVAGPAEPSPQPGPARGTVAPTQQA